ncbi:MAG: hypothetical protein Q9161_005377 [Pseudevernia consocians]
MNLLIHGLAPYRPNPPSIKPAPYPHAFGASISTRSAVNLSWTQRFDRKPDNSTYYLTFENYFFQHLRPSPYSNTSTFRPSYQIFHKQAQASHGRKHDIAILRDDGAKSGGVAVINYLLHTIATLITYPKTGLTQDLLCDPSRCGDDSTGIVVHLRDYLVCIDTETCVWLPLGPARVNRDGTTFGMMELRNVMDGKLCATLGSERVGESDNRVTKRCVMVRGEWAPGTEPFEQVIASLIAMMGRECDRIGLLKHGAGPILP